MSGTVLVLGGGAREHALARALARTANVVVAPGNDGMRADAECRPVDLADHAAVAALAKDLEAGFVVVGPEAPLVDGIADTLRSLGLAVLGPGREAARLEGSKAYMKGVAAAAGVPTAAHAAFTTREAALAHLDAHGVPIVVKADGLAEGKGVTVADTVDEARAAVEACFDGRFGEAASVVLEERLAGAEISAFVLCDRTGAVRYLGDAQDHKRLADGDRGPNTGGMGAVSPAPLMTDALRADVVERFVRPTLAEMARRGTPFGGVLFVGLMLTADGPKLLEYNVRLGDPEAQVLLPRLEGDLAAMLALAARDGLASAPEISASRDAACGVVMAAPGYPDAPRQGDAIRGLDAEGRLPGHDVVHAATVHEDGRWTANGGRVLTVLGRGADVATARASAYAGVAAIGWPDAQWRHDIGTTGTGDAA